MDDGNYNRNSKSFKLKNKKHNNKIKYNRTKGSRKYYDPKRKSYTKRKVKTSIFLVIFSRKILIRNR